MEIYPTYGNTINSLFKITQANRLGLYHTQTVSLQKDKTPRKSVMDMALNHLKARLQFWRFV